MSPRGLVVVSLVLGLVIAATPSHAQSEGMSLAEAIERALAGNRQLVATAARVAEQEAALGAARSERWPSLAFSQRLTRIDSSTVERANAAATGLSLLIGFEIPPFVFQDSYRTQLEAALPLWTSGARRSSIEGAKAGLGARLAELEAAERVVAVRVVRRFFALARADVVGEARLKALERARERLREAERRLEVGLGTRQEVLRWRVEVESALAAVAATEADVFLARLELADELALDPVMMGTAVMGERLGRLELPAPEGVDRLLEWAETLDPTAVLAEADDVLTASPEVRSARADETAAEQAVAAARAARRPRLDASAAYGWLENETLELDEFENWSASLVLSVPLDLRGRQRSEVALQEARRQAAGVAVDEARAQRRLELGRALADVMRLRARLRSARRAEDEATSRRELLARRTEVGLASLLDLVDADTTLVEAEVARVTARVDLLAAIAALELAWPGADPPAGGLIP